jgi:hypothetical protein
MRRNRTPALAPFLELKARDDDAIAVGVTAARPGAGELQDA